MARVAVTHSLPGDLAGWLPGHEIVYGIDRDEAALAQVEGLICLLTVRVDEALLARAPKLRVVANYAVGLDNVDVAAATRRGVAVANTPDVLTEATADLAFALLLAAARRLVEGDALVRRGEWRGWEPGQLLGADLQGKTLGLVGYGRIGQAMARRAEGFGLRVLHVRRGGDLLAMLRESDFVSLHCPLTPETRHLIGARELETMKPGAVLVNTARGPIVDEAALVAALRAGRVRAGLDVFEEEPRVPEALRALPNVVLAPHIGSATRGAREGMARLCATAVATVLAGGRPANVVNPEVLA